MNAHTKKCRQAVAAVLTAMLLAGPLPGAGAADSVKVSAWAQEGVQAAYESGAVSPEFDIGTDYTQPVSRAQIARLLVDLVAHERQVTIADLIAQYNIVMEQQPEPELAEEPEESEENPEEPEESPGESEENSGEPEESPEETVENPEESEESPGESEENSGEPEESPEETVENPEESEESPEETVENPEESPEEPETIPEESPVPELPVGDPLDGGLPYVLAGSFSDTRSVYIELAAKMGIVNGTDGLFYPDKAVTRAEAAAMMQRCMNVLGCTEANQQPQQFSDNYEIPRWAVEAVKFVSGRVSAAGQPIMGGANGKFSPRNAYTIEQAILSAARMQSSRNVTTAAEGWRTAPGYDEVSLALTFGGDCTFGRGHDFSYSGSFDEMYDNQGASYFFSGIPEFFDDDLTMVNFEGTLTTATRRANKTFTFKGRPAYAEILQKGSIDVVSIANNHSMDYLQQGFDDTIRYLTPYVQISGYQRMPIVTVKGIRIGFASNVGWSFDNAQKRYIENAVKSLRERGADLVIFNYHWGIERSYHSDPTQRAIGHYCIDQGADLVIGHHPHVVQEVETYKGKQIAYSLGNLVFGGNHNPAEKNCLIYRHNFTLNLDTRKVTGSTPNAIPYRVSSVNWRNDYHPVKR